MGNGGNGLRPSKGYLDNFLVGGLGEPPVTDPFLVPFGCGVNPEGSLTVISGSTNLGSTVIFGIDNPLGTQPAGSSAILYLSFAPDASFSLRVPPAELRHDRARGGW